MSATLNGSGLLTAEEIIDRLLGEPALRRVACDCVLPAVRVGTEWRFRESDLDAWIARRNSTANRQPATGNGTKN